MPHRKLFLASTYAFNESGVRDVYKLVESLDAKLRTTFLSTNHVFVINGDISKEKSEACIALFREYLDNHAHENLLDVPPIRPLSRFSLQTTTTCRSTIKGSAVDTLLDLEESLVATAARFTEIWEPSIENDYFATDPWGILPRLALEHDVEISVETLADAKPTIHISGTIQSNVQAAIGRIAAMEKPLSFVKRPSRGLIFVTPHHESSSYSFSIVRYSSINRTALRRVLVGLDSPAARDIPGMLAPVLCCHNVIVSNIEKPANIQPTSEDIRAWRDYRFPEIGDRHLYTHLAAYPRGISRPSVSERPLDRGPLPRSRAQSVESRKLGVSNLAHYCSLDPQEEIEADPGYDHVSRWGSVATPSPAVESLDSVGGESVPQKLPPGIKTRKVLVRAKDSSGINPAPSLQPGAKESPAPPAGKSTIDPQKVQSKGALSIDVSGDMPAITSKPDGSSAAKRIGFQGEDLPGFESQKSTLPSTDPSSPAVCETLPLIDLDDKPPVGDQPSPHIGVTSMWNRESRSPGQSFHSSPREEFPSSSSLLQASFQASPETKSSSTTGEENNAWARKFLLKEIQESSRASIWSDYLAEDSANTRSSDSQSLISECQVPAQDKAKGEVHERLARDDETPRVLHSLMRNKSPRRRFFGWQKSPVPPCPAFRIEVVPDLVRNDSPRVSPGLQPELHNTRSLPSAEQIQQIKSLFEALKPLLEVASWYPGSLSLEFQLGLVLIPQPSQTLEGRYKDLEKLRSRLLPRSGLPAPTTLFFDRLTTSAADVDSIVDLEVHGVHLFAPEPVQRETRFEFHCDAEAGDLIIVVYVDEFSKAAEVRAPSETLGSVHISFPGQVWDAAVVIRGEMNPLGIHPDIDKRAQHIVDTLWVEPDQGRVHLFASILQDKLSVKKVFVKRCTQYRHYLHQDNKMIDQDIFLQVIETQDLIIRQLSQEGILEAYCASPDQMTSEHRQWWQVSIVSPVVNSALKPTTNHLPGSPGGWSASDLLGHDKDLVFGETLASPGSPLACGDPARESSTTATGIGSAGIGSLLRLTEILVENIDAVGFWNSCSGVLPAATSTSPPSPSSQPIETPSRSKTPMQNTNRELVLRITKPRERGASAERLVADPAFW